MKWKSILRVTTAIAVVFSALLGYVACQWPDPVYDAIWIPSPGKALKRIKASGDDWVFHAVQFSNELYVIEWKME